MVVNLNIFSSYLVEGETEDETEGGVTSPARPHRGPSLPKRKTDANLSLQFLMTQMYKTLCMCCRRLPLLLLLSLRLPLCRSELPSRLLQLLSLLLYFSLSCRSESAHPTVGISEDANFGQVVAAAAPVLQPTADPTAALGGPSAATCVERTHGRRSVFHL